MNKIFYLIKFKLLKIQNQVINKEDIKIRGILLIEQIEVIKKS